MAYGSMDIGDDASPMAEINMVPLIDVMLVLLVIFLVTAPLLTHAVKLDLPKASSSSNLVKPETVQLAIDATGEVSWNAKPVDATHLALQLRQAADTRPQPEIQISADRKTPYEKLAQVLSEAARTGVTRIGFVTDPAGP